MDGVESQTSGFGSHTNLRIDGSNGSSFGIIHAPFISECLNT
jgi:hypothetical protein